MQEPPSEPRTELTRLRRAAGLSQADLATALGLKSPRAVKSWERGDHLPSISHALPLARLLGVPLQEVVEAIAGPDPGAAPDIPDLTFLRADLRRLVEALLRESAPHDGQETPQTAALTAEVREALLHHSTELGRLIQLLRPDNDG